MLASDGYRIVALDRNREGLIHTQQIVAEHGSDALAIEVDVADSTALRRGITDGIVHFGRADVLVNGAGFVQNRPFLELEEADWDRMHDVHLKASFTACQAILPTMRDAGYGRIVCVASTAALTGSPNHVHYVSAKAGLIGFVRALAFDVGQWGVTVNAVIPGAVETPLIAGMYAGRLATVSETPVGRVGQPEDIAHAIRYLCSPESGYTSGALLRVSGGL